MSEVRILEQGKPLSECLIWPLIEKFYGESGPEAWSQTQTPYYPTNNAFLAESYAELIVAYLRDAAPTLDPEEPVYILEMAAGLGVMAHLILAALPQKLQAFAATSDLQIRYVLTDFTEHNIEFWNREAHLDRPEIDVALFQSEKSDELILRRSGVQLAPGTLKNPPIILANYFFDSIRHDYFWTEQGKLFDVRPVICHLSDIPVSLATISLYGQGHIVDPATRYPDARWNQVLKQYTEELPDGSFLFPVGAFQAIENLKRLGNGRGLLLCADKGYHTLAAMEGRREVPYTPHTGSFSFMVNFDAVRRYIEGSGGVAWHGAPSPALEGFAAVFERGDWEALSLMAPARLADISDKYTLALRLPNTLTEAEPLEGFSVALAAIRAFSGDSWVFQTCGDLLMQGAQSNSSENVAALKGLLPLIESRLSPTVVGAFSAYGWLRSLLFHLGEREYCQALNAHIVRLFGPHRDGFFYPAAIAEVEGDTKEALALYQQASELDPACTLCQEAIKRLKQRRSAA